MSASMSHTSGSMCALPEKPRFTTGKSPRLPAMAVNAIPGREAHAPWVMDEP